MVVLFCTGQNNDIINYNATDTVDTDQFIVQVIGIICHGLTSKVRE